MVVESHSSDRRSRNDETRRSAPLPGVGGHRALHTGGHRFPGPDFSRLSTLVGAGVKVAVATRKSLSANPDALERQFGDPENAGLGGRSFIIIELQPCELEQVDEALTRASPCATGR